MFSRHVTCGISQEKAAAAVKPIVLVNPAELQFLTSWAWRFKMYILQLPNPDGHLHPPFITTSLCQDIKVDKHTGSLGDAPK